MWNIFQNIIHIARKEVIVNKQQITVVIVKAQRHNGHLQFSSAPNSYVG
jgi:hypothetical protein